MPNHLLIAISKTRKSSFSGSAIIETVVGLFVLLPVFLILLDIIALVIGQTINDDIAKKAARYAAQESTQPAAAAAAANYIVSTPYTGPKGLVSQARISNFTWNTTQVQVTTEVTINLPVPVPLGGPSSQVMQTQATEPTVGVAAVPPGGAGS